MKLDLMFGKDEGSGQQEALESVVGTGFDNFSYFSYQVTIKLKVEIRNANDYRKHVLIWSNMTHCRYMMVCVSFGTGLTCRNERILEIKTSFFSKEIIEPTGWTFASLFGY